MKDFIKKERKMELEYIFGLMGAIILDNGKKVVFMAMENMCGWMAGYIIINIDLSRSLVQ